MQLLLFIFRLVFSKNQQGYGTTIVELSAQRRSLGVSQLQAKAALLCAGHINVLGDIRVRGSLTL